MRINCDPAVYNAAGIMMRSIDDTGNNKTTTHDGVLANTHEVLRRFRHSEARVTLLVDAKTTWLPPLVVETMQFTQHGAVEDFDATAKKIDECQLIKNKVSGSQLLRTVQVPTVPESPAPAW